MCKKVIGVDISLEAIEHAKINILLIILNIYKEMLLIFHFQPSIDVAVSLKPLNI
jgi:methylase of polypeptide subunit release factors